MPIIFKVVDPKNTPSEYFAYNDDAQPIGDPSVYARVYPVYPSHRDGLNLNAREASQWIVKENQSPTEDRRFIAEYELMQKLAQSTQQRAGSACSP